MDTDLTGAVGAIPERFVPDVMRGDLVDAEHRARYWWAARLAEGRRVLDAGCGLGYGSDILAAGGAREVVGVDLAAAVVEAARSESARPEASFAVADVRSLPFDDWAFELVCCFEVIEHVEEPERVLDELVRVLGPDGLLAVSSPNRDVYVPGNPHHLRELRPEELERELAARLGHVRLFRQSDWTASAVLSDEAAARDDAAELAATPVRKVFGRDPGEETYTIGLAGRRPLPDIPASVVLTHTLELRLWLESWDEQQRVLRAQADHMAHQQALDGERRELRRQLMESERQLARVHEIEVALAEAERDLGEAERALAGQAEVVEQRDWAMRMLAQTRESLSWQITAPLRRAKERVDRRRSG